MVAYTLKGALKRVPVGYREYCGSAALAIFILADYGRI